MSHQLRVSDSEELHAFSFRLPSMITMSGALPRLSLAQNKEQWGASLVERGGGRSRSSSYPARVERFDGNREARQALALSVAGVMANYAVLVLDHGPNWFSGLCSYLQI
jgi:hypothetical protein